MSDVSPDLPRSWVTKEGVHTWRLTGTKTNHFRNLVSELFVLTEHGHQRVRPEEVIFFGGRLNGDSEEPLNIYACRPGHIRPCLSAVGEDLHMFYARALDDEELEKIARRPAVEIRATAAGDLNGERQLYIYVGSESTERKEKLEPEDIEIFVGTDGRFTVGFSCRKGNIEKAMAEAQKLHGIITWWGTLSEADIAGATAEQQAKIREVRVQEASFFNEHPKALFNQVPDFTPIPRPKL